MPYVSNSNIITDTGQISDNVIKTADIADAQVTPAKISNGTEGQVLTAGASQPAWTDPASIPAGTVLAYAGSSAPTGYLFADGSAVSRTTYATLFTAISTTYGTGDGSTTFNLPDLGTRIPVGYKSGDSDFGTVGGTGGEKTHTLIVSEMPSHSHRLSTSNTGNGLKGWNADTTNGQTYVAGSPESTGGDGAHNNLQPYITMKYIIKT